MADSSTSLAGIIYYARERYYQHIQTAVLEVVKKYGADPILSYWKAYSLIMSGRLLEGIRELEMILEKPEVMLCSSMLLAYAHKKCETVDRQEVQKLEAKIRTERTSCGEKALYNAGMFLWLCGRHDKAREYVDRMLKMVPASREGLTLRGWVDLTSGREALMKRSIKYFEEALAEPDQPKLAEAFFGKSKFYLNRYNFSHSLDVLNQAVAAYDGFLPALVEKMKVQLALQDWEQALETAHRCLGEDVNCIEATRMLTLGLLAREGKYSEAAGSIGELIQLIDRFEPNNHTLYHEVSLALARMSGGKTLVLQQTMTLVHRALSLAPANAEYITELAYQLYLSGQLQESLVQYKRAMNTDETSVPALAGIIMCQILEGHTSEAEQQLEFLAEVQSSIGKQPGLLFLNALLAQRKNKPASELLPIIGEIVDIHFSSVKGTPLSIKYFELINPHFLLEIAKVLMVYAPTMPPATSSQVDPVLRRAASVLDPLCKSMPGMLASLFMLAKIKFLSGEAEPAQMILQRIIDRDSDSMEAHLLMARIQLHRGNVKQCSTSLEMALSSNFEIQNYAVYHLVKAQCERRQGDTEGALTSLKTAMSFLTRRSAKVTRQPSQALLPPLTMGDQVTVHLELASVHAQLGHSHEATKVIQDAINEFTGTSEEFRITLANADFALAREDVDEALSLLRNIGEENRYYIQAKEKMADIYLNRKKDKKMYIACYNELSGKMPGPPTALILGDAYMNIQEPEKALEVYEASLKRNARDSVLASKVGQALIKTHHYNKAIIYYETALRSEAQQFLRRDLAGLFLKLRQFEKAEKTIRVALEQGEEMELAKMMERVDYMRLLAKVHREAKQAEKALPVLNSASQLQAKVLIRVGIEQSDSTQSQKGIAASIFFDMAEMSYQLADSNSAIDFYCRALKKQHDFLLARLALAKLYLKQGDLTSCDQECVILLRVDQDNEQAALMRADLLSHRGYDTYQEAIHHLQELLSRKPAHFSGLCRYVGLAWRTGELDKAQFYIDQAEKACTRAAYEPGLNYCKGLFKKYKHEANEALQNFNQARKDAEWGERALFAMIEICLNPENDMIAGEMLKPIVDSATDDQIAIKTAEKLLLEVQPCSPASEHKVKLLECYILLSHRQKTQTEKALEKLMVMASENRNEVGMLMAIASAHMLLKQVPRARNQLKVASKLSWTPENGEDFEQAWLLLADIFIQSGKYDVALELLKKCIAYNKSCTKAWEYRGFISEKEHAYKDAASYYEQAWKYSYHANPTVGFKLAFNYLKAKWYVGAIDVCHQVLEKHPKYPKIREDILEKARASIRA